jgi:NAD(P)-dependent dehydrogenase (short-subunit alcohol dehydrogenase family)
MLLKNKTAVIYGAYGSVGKAIAKAFAKEGANVFLTGRDLPKVKAAADEITGSGFNAEAAQVDATDQGQIKKHLDQVVSKTGRVDISFNAIGIPQTGIQGVPIVDLEVDNFSKPIETYARSHFLTARTAARQMLQQKSGVILMHTPEPAVLAAPYTGGMAPAWASLESLSRTLSGELGPAGIRSICIRSTGIPETKTIDTVFGLHGKALGLSYEQFKGLMEGMSHNRRSTTLSELANAAVFAASDLASGMTGAVINITGGKVAD